MRTIKVVPVVIFFTILSVVVLLAGFITLQFEAHFSFLGSSFIFKSILFVTIFFALMFLFYRLSLKIWPITVGEVPLDSALEFNWSLNTLFWLFIFHPLLRPQIVPVPFTPIIYRMLGAKVGPGTFFSGLVLDPHFVEVGSHVIVGADSMIVPHVLYGDLLAHYKIKIGNNVTIGLRATIMPGVVIEDGAVIAAHALVAKDTHVLTNEIWGGVPAKKIGVRG